MAFTMSLLSVRAGGAGAASAASRAGGQAIAPQPVPLARMPARPASRAAAAASLAASAGCHVGPRSACGAASRQTLRRRQRAVAAASGAENGASSNGKPVVENVVVVGSGPAGYTAAIYAARANLKPVVFEGLRNGRGGQLMGTTEVENFPGFPEGITGPQLMERMAQQAERWGAELYPEDVEAVNLDQRPFWVRTAEREVRAHTIIMATGATALRLRLPHEDAFWSKGISACAICDGASPLFKNKPVAVVGGGDSACEEAVYLTKYASHVHLLVRKNGLRASKAMADRTMENEKITVHFETSVDDAYGKDVLEGLKIKTKDGIKDLPVAGLFYGIGHQPNSSLFDKWVETDEKGYVVIKHGVDTSVDGVFSAGDLHDPEWRQAITAAGSGCMAALSAERYLTERGIGTEFKSSHPEEPSASHASEAASKASSDGQTNGGTSSDEDSFDPTQDKHKGQFALRKLYHSSDRPIVVLYTSPSCGPCRSLKPIMNKVVDEFPGRVHYVLIDIEKDPEIAEAAGVNGTPTLQLFKNKERLVNTPGVKSKSDYRKMIQEALDSALVAA